MKRGNKLNILYPCVDHHVQGDKDEEGQDLEEDVGDARHLDGVGSIKSLKILNL